MRKPIAISLSPNVTAGDIVFVFKKIWLFLQYKNGKEIGLLETWFKNFFSVSYAISFNSGRGALYAILSSLEIGKSDEVLLQAFTCVAVPNSIIATGAKPIYVDIDESFTINTIDLEKKISPRTKAIIVQHTFGIPARMGEVIKIASLKNIPIIEDCAHGIGGSYNGKKMGTFGLVSFFSFGRDKAFSSVFGGITITNNKKLAQKLKDFQKKLSYPSFLWIFQQLSHPLAFTFILPLYDFFGLGKLLLVLLQKIHILSFPVLKEEKKGNLPSIFVQKMPNILCSLALFQLSRIDEFNKKREQIGNIYIKKLTSKKIQIPFKESCYFLRFPIFVEQRDKLYENLKSKNIYIGKWYSEIIDPKGTDIDSIFYSKGSCKNAEETSQKIINLPTYPTLSLSQLHTVIREVNNYV